MIPGVGTNGQFPNHSIGLPVLPNAKSMTPKVFVRKLANVRLQNRKNVRLANYPKS